jgi:hypothetical protein
MVMLSLTSTIATAQKFMCLKRIDFNANYRFPAKHMDVFNLNYFDLKFWTFYSSIGYPVICEMLMCGSGSKIWTFLFISWFSYFSCTHSLIKIGRQV